MELANKLSSLVITVLILGIIGIAGCTQTGMQRSNEARISLQTMDNDIKSAALQLDATGASLGELMKAGPADVKKAFNIYSDNVSKMESMEKGFVQHANEMQVRGMNYFEEWQKEGTEYKNPQIQKLSEERRATLGEVYGKITEHSIGMKEAFNKYVSDIKEIQRFLSNDLTTKGISAIAPTSQEVIDNGYNLKYVIENVQANIQVARAEMSQSGNGM